LRAFRANREGEEKPSSFGAQLVDLHPLRVSVADGARLAPFLALPADDVVAASDPLHGRPAQGALQHFSDLVKLTNPCHELEPRLFFSLCPSPMPRKSGASQQASQASQASQRKGDCPDASRPCRRTPLSEQRARSASA
jgi:hypothetical protein